MRILTQFMYTIGQWCAWRDGTEESGVRGWGATEAEAIADLLAVEEV